MNAYLRILKYVKPYMKDLGVAFVCMLVLSAVSTAIVPIVGKMSESIGARDFGMINLLAAGLIGFFFLKSIFTFLQQYLIAATGQKIIRDIRMEIYEHIQYMSLDFFTKWKVGDIIFRTITDIQIMQNATVNSVTSFLPNLMTVVGVCGYMLYLNWRLALITICIMPLLAFISAKFGTRIREVALSMQTKAADLASQLHETFTGAKVVKTFTMEKYEVGRFGEVSNAALEVGLKVSTIYASQTPLFSFIQVVSAVIVMWFGGLEIVAGRLSAPSLIAFFSGIILLGDPIAQLSTVNVQVQRALISAGRIFQIIDMEPTIKESPAAKTIDPFNGKVEFKNVYFKYDTNENIVLKNINLNIDPGEVIALVGPSGAGKSTLANLIPRFYDPIEGDILIDSTDIKDLKLIPFRKNIAIVPQETLLFSATIRENIAYGRINAREEEIIEAAKMANAHDFIMNFPQNYNTVIGEKGIRLSGGERQRVSIARALLKNPKILILDEATSSLDAESEMLVQNALEKLMVGRTTFVIAHRFSTVKIANKIIVLDKGEMVQIGTHGELMEKSGMYKKLYDMQLGSFTETLPNVFGFIEMRGNEIHLTETNTLSGWLIADNNSNISKVQVLSSDNRVIGEGKAGIPRPDVQKGYPNFKHSLESGFEVGFKLEGGLHDDYTLRVFDDKNKEVKTLKLALTELTRSGCLPV